MRSARAVAALAPNSCRCEYAFCRAVGIVTVCPKGFLAARVAHRSDLVYSSAPVTPFPPRSARAPRTGWPLVRFTALKVFSALRYLPKMHPVPHPPELRLREDICDGRWLQRRGVEHHHAVGGRRAVDAICAEHERTGRPVLTRIRVRVGGCRQEVAGKAGLELCAGLGKGGWLLAHHTGPEVTGDAERGVRPGWARTESLGPSPRVA